MKTNRLIATVMVLANLSFSQIGMAQEQIILPVITKPVALQEGTQRELSKDQIAELLPWAKNSKIFLSDMLDNIQSLSTADKVDRLVEGITTVVGDSGPKNSELLMRYALNRGLVIHGILSAEMAADAVGTSDAKLRVLVSSVKLAIKYYDSDMEYLTKKTGAPYVLFGIEYFEFLNELNKSVFDATAQYNLQKTALEFLQWDLYRDLNNTTFAPQIVKVNNALKLLPKKSLTDAQAIAQIRQMKALAQQLKLRETLRTVSESMRQLEIKLQNEEIERGERKRREDSKVKVGDVVLDISDGSNPKKGVVAAIQGENSFIVKHSSGSIASNLERRKLALTNGCSSRLCVGETVYNVTRDVNVVIAGIMLNGDYVVSFTYGELAGKSGSDWKDIELAKLSGCGEEGICVGDKMINTARNATVVIRGIQTNKKYYVEFTSGELRGQKGPGWASDYLVKDGLNR